MGIIREVSNVANEQWERERARNYMSAVIDYPGTNLYKKILVEPQDVPFWIDFLNVVLERVCTGGIDKQVSCAERFVADVAEFRDEFTEFARSHRTNSSEPLEVSVVYSDAFWLLDELTVFIDLASERSFKSLHTAKKYLQALTPYYEIYFFDELKRLYMGS